MKTETTLHLLCGKMAAGKSTLAKKLAKKHNAILLVEDEWLLTLYPEEIKKIPDYIKYSLRLKNIVLQHIRLLLLHGLPVVLDFPANTKEQRKYLRTIFEKENIGHILHYVDTSNDLCKHQLRQRSKDKSDGSAFTTDAEFDAITKYFQPPSEDEGFNIIHYKR